jgi:septal ring factor EnvC (AmiA/AmiB activator)
MRLEREYAQDIASLKDSLEGEEEEWATLEEKLDSIEESNNEVISKLIKERDHARAKVKMLKRKRLNLVLVMINLLRI